MRKNLSIRQHLKGEKLDIHYYEYISDQISKEVPIIAHSNIEKAKIERVQHVYSDMLNSQKTIFRPLKFESDCCNVNVVFNHNDMTYTCPACHNKVSCHADYMPKGLLTSKKNC
jgi:ribosomal protein S27E